MKQLFTYLFLVISATIIAQAPQSIPYQAVVRNTDGSVMADAAVTMTFKIHDNSATGIVVYEENHTATTNAQGLISLNVGNGVVVLGTFSGVNWGSGSKFLHVLMNAGSGVVDLGTQQMMSVPYALYAEDVDVRVSATGDTLFIGSNYSIVPGVSAANPVSISNYGSVLLPGNTTCQNEYISVTGCGGQDSLLYYDRYYSLTEIGGQCWFAENLATDKYSNGDNIPTGLSNIQWQNTTSGAYVFYNDDIANDVNYGKLYNWYTTVDTRGVCPTGWHVSTACEWDYLVMHIGGYLGSGGKLKSTAGWWLNGLNTFGFNAMPGSCYYFDSGVDSGVYYFGGNSPIGSSAFWWSSSSINISDASLRCISMAMGSNDLSPLFLSNIKNNGFSLRCIKD